jgi:hypothetical protein
MNQINQNPTPIKYRNMWAQVGLMIITLGFYSIYWFHQTAVELAGLAGDHRAEPGLWTILLFIPFAGLFSHFKYSELFETVSASHLGRWILWLLWIVFSPAVWLIVQSELNRRATYA